MDTHSLTGDTTFAINAEENEAAEEDQIEEAANVVEEEIEDKVVKGEKEEKIICIYEDIESEELDEDEEDALGDNDYMHFKM